MRWSPTGAGRARPGRDAVLSSRTADGGFGYALEPDGRGPESQPPHVYLALQLLEEAGGVGEDLAREVADHLLSVSADDGGVPLALPSLEPTRTLRGGRSSRAAR